MRPGLLCPGSGDYPDGYRCYCESFNEAGAVMPRKLWINMIARQSRRSFNEAGAVMPRKPRFPSGKFPPKRCFNEAGAVMPRKLRQLEVRQGISFRLQ